MTAIEELRRLLDERGVKWTSERVSDGVLFTFAKDGHTYSVFVRDRAGLEIWSQYLTPEQAIAATLGAQRPTLPHFWTADGTLHVEPRRMPERVQAHLGGEDVTFERGLGTCHDNGYIDDGEMYFVCSECGCEFDYTVFACEFAEGHATGSPKACPNCGRKVVGE